MQVEEEEPVISDITDIAGAATALPLFPVDTVHKSFFMLADSTTEE